MSRLLRSMLDDAGLTQAQLAKAVGVSESAVSKWVRGERNPHLDHLHAIAAACGCAVQISTMKERSLAARLARVEHALRPYERGMLGQLLEDLEARTATEERQAETG